MGEIAESMINGDACEACGMPFFSEGPGYPRYCCQECAEGRGAVWVAWEDEFPDEETDLIDEE